LRIQWCEVCAAKVALEEARPNHWTDALYIVFAMPTHENLREQKKKYLFETDIRGIE